MRPYLLCNPEAEAVLKTQGLEERCKNSLCINDVLPLPGILCRGLHHATMAGDHTSQRLKDWKVLLSCNFVHSPGPAKRGDGSTV